MGISWIILVILRFLLVLSPQTGYIHPDEFFQSVEIAAGDVHKKDVFRAWEFNSSMPLRSISSPYIMSGLPIVTLKYLQDNAYITVSPFLLLILPRLWMAFLSLVTDYSVFFMCRIFGFDGNLALKLYASSYVALVYVTRTFSNSLESVYLALFFIVFLKSSVVPEKQRKHRMSRDNVNPYLFQLSSLSVFVITTIMVAGIFNRPTFLLFTSIPTLLWFLLLIKPLTLSTAISHLVKVKVVGLMASIVAFVVFVTIDTQYYRPDAVKNVFTEAPICLNSDFSQIFDCFKNSFSDFVVAPYNFLLYNMQSENLAQHGLHSRFLHIGVNLPLLLGPLIIPIYYTIIVMIMSVFLNKFKTDGRILYLIIIFLSPVLLLSIFAHQEPRFLIPVIPVGCVLVSGIVGSKKGRKALWSVWIIFNLLMTLFYGYLHQGGVIPSIMDAKNEVSNSKQHSYLLFYKTYMPPRFILTSNNVKIIDLAGAPLNEAYKTISDLRKKSVDSSIQIFTPATVFPYLKSKLGEHFKLEIICPHLSLEDPPDFMHILKTYHEMDQHLSELCINIIKLD